MINTLKKKKLFFGALTLLIAFSNCKNAEEPQPKGDATTTQNNSSQSTIEFVEFTLDGQTIRQEYPGGYTLLATYVEANGITQTTITSSGAKDVQVSIQSYVNGKESQPLGSFSGNQNTTDSSYIILTVNNEAYYSKSGTLTFTKFQKYDTYGGIAAGGTFSGVFFKEDLTGNIAEFQVANGKFNVN